MCSIIGMIAQQAVAPQLVSALEGMEYRGHDSVGMATLTKQIQVRKDKGDVPFVLAKHKLGEMKGCIGLGHTRWATHGTVCKKNAHPHLSCNKQIAVVHNGNIDNYQTLRNKLHKHIFRSDTDTEVIPHLLEKHKVLEVVKMLEGSNAFVAMMDNKLIAYCHDLPLIFGVSRTGKVIASDIIGIVKAGIKYLASPLPNDTILVVEHDTYRLYDLKGEMTNGFDWQSFAR